MGVQDPLVRPALLVPRETPGRLVTLAQPARWAPQETPEYLVTLDQPAR